MEFEEDDTPQLRLEIDRLKLDEEWAGQSQMFHVWAMAAANVQLAYDTAKSKLELVSAELDSDIRTNPQVYGLEKVTEVALNQFIVTQPQYQAAYRNLNKARHALEVAKAAVNALEHRKRALTMLVELFIKDYYSEQTVRSTEDAEERKRIARSRGRRRAEQEAEGDRDGE